MPLQVINKIRETETPDDSRLAIAKLHRALSLKILNHIKALRMHQRGHDSVK